MIYKRLGDYIELVNERNSELQFGLPFVRGVSIQKKFIETKANMSNVSLHNYKIVKKKQFAFNPNTSRNGDKLSIAMSHSSELLVTSIYTVFQVKDLNQLLPEYLFLFFKRSEFDRYARFHSWGSARETFTWEDMCDLKIPIPSIDEQKKYLNISKGLIANQKVYDDSFEDLQLVCDTYIENLIKTEKPKLLEEYIEKINERNSELQFGLPFVRGVSIQKKFIETKANMSNVSLHNYKIVKKKQFAFNPNTSRNGDKLSIAMSHSSELLVTSIYTVFQVKDLNQLLPEYLFLFFKRSEFDRYARFHSWGSARETFTWEDMCDLKIPIPSIAKQEAIISVYNVLEARKHIKDQLNETIKKISPTLIRGVVENNEIY